MVAKRNEMPRRKDLLREGKKKKDTETNAEPTLAEVGKSDSTPITKGPAKKPMGKLEMLKQMKLKQEELRKKAEEEEKQLKEEEEKRRQLEELAKKMEELKMRQAKETAAIPKIKSSNLSDKYTRRIEMVRRANAQEGTPAPVYISRETLGLPQKKKRSRFSKKKSVNQSIQSADKVDSNREITCDLAVPEPKDSVKSDKTNATPPVEDLGDVAEHDNVPLWYKMDGELSQSSDDDAESTNETAPTVAKTVIVETQPESIIVKPNKSSGLLSKTNTSPAQVPKKSESTSQVPPTGPQKKESSIVTESARLRAPICCVLGHVDTGKTKILDWIRATSVQKNEVGGITQQIGSTFIPREAMEKKIHKIFEKDDESIVDISIPGLLVIDTPGHESFANLRNRGSSICNIAVLVVDIMHGLESQTIMSIEMLRGKKIPFVIALNKIDRLYDWKSDLGSPIPETLKNQSQVTMNDFEQRYEKIKLSFAEMGFNTELYYDNNSPSTQVSIIPTSAITGEGITDLLYYLTKLTQQMMKKILVSKDRFEATVMEVKQQEGFGSVIDVILVNGVLKVNDNILLSGLAGPIETTVRNLLLPAPLSETRTQRLDYDNVSEIEGTTGVRIVANNLELALPGSPLFQVTGSDCKRERRELEKDMSSIMGTDWQSSYGVFIHSSTLGSLEALIEYLKANKMPIRKVAVGPPTKQTIINAANMHQLNKGEYAVVLCFNLSVSKEITQFAADQDVKIIEGEIIYHLLDKYHKYVENYRNERKALNAKRCVFPCVLEFLPNSTYNARDPIIIGVKVLMGTLHMGTPLAMNGRPDTIIGIVDGIEFNKLKLNKLSVNESGAIRIVPKSSQLYVVGRHVFEGEQLLSRITRNSLNVLREFYRDELTVDDVKLVKKLKKVFSISD